VNQDNKEFVVADIPGLIKGAHEGQGLGHRFLGHVERCKGLIHLIDITSKNIVNDYTTIINEISAYDENLSKKKQIVVLNKIDAVEKDVIETAKKKLKKINVNKVVCISAVSGQNITNLIRETQDLIVSMLEAEDDNTQLENVSWSP
jgi:GTP-binding protein